MNRHPYLRAYMAGIAVPSMFMLLALTFFCIARFVYHHPIPIERLMIFSMTLVPNAWGMWNMLYVRLNAHHRIPIGLYGAGLLALLIPMGFIIQKAVDVMIWTPSLVVIVFPIGAIVYYLVWKHVVAFLNELVGIG